jgi:hypothetical protein
MLDGLKESEDDDTGAERSYWFVIRATSGSTGMSINTSLMS